MLITAARRLYAETARLVQQEPTINQWRGAEQETLIRSLPLERL